MQIRFPAGRRGVDEGLHRLGVRGDQSVRGQGHGRVAGVALVGEQEDGGLDVALLLDGVGLAGRIALLDHPLVGEEGPGVEGVLVHLAVGESVPGLEPDPEGRHRGVRQQDRPALHVGQGADALVGMGDQHLRVLLHIGRHRLHRRLLLGQVEGDEAVGAHAQVHRIGGQQLRHVHRRTALDDGHVQAALLVLAGGQGLVESALFGLGAPVGGEADRGQASLTRRRRGLLCGRAGGEHRRGGERDQTRRLQGRFLPSERRA